MAWASDQLYEEMEKKYLNFEMPVGTNIRQADNVAFTDFLKLRFNIYPL